MQIINGVLVSLLTEIAKRIQSVPITPEQIGRIRILGIILSLLAVLVTDYANGTLASSGAIAIVVETLSTWLSSVLVYHGLIKS